MVVVISNPNPVKDEQLIIRQLFDAGLEFFHLRKKELTEKELRSFIEKFPVYALKKVVLHSHYHLVKEYGLKGIHVPASYQGQDNPETLSVSFHSPEEIEQSRLSYNYGFLSPLFESISKEGYRGNFDFEKLKKFLSKREEKIIALGGIDEDKTEKARELGFSGIAIMGAIWKSAEPVEKFKRIREKWRN